MKGYIFCRDNDPILKSGLSVNSNYLSGAKELVEPKELVSNTWLYTVFHVDSMSITDNIAVLMS